MSQFRQVTVTLFLAALIGASLYDVVRDDDHWPFSNYGMYSNVETSTTLTRLRVVGVRENGGEEILTDYHLLQPLDQARLEAALENIVGTTVGHPDQRRDLLTKGLDDISRRYEVLRVAGRHTGPRLKGLRLYEVSWQLDPLARNVTQPSRKNLLAEVTAAPSNAHD